MIKLSQKEKSLIYEFALYYVQHENMAIDGAIIKATKNRVPRAYKEEEYEDESGKAYDTERTVMFSQNIYKLIYNNIKRGTNK